MNHMDNQTSLLGRVAVLMGGQSAERAISLKSGSAVLAALIAQGVDATGLDVDHTIAARLLEGHFDRAFIVLHGRGGEDGEIQGLLKSLRIPFTGSGVTASAVSMNKRLTKAVWRAAGLPTPESISVTADSVPAVLVEQLGLPLVIKPVHEGSSIGMSKVEHESQLAEAMRTALEYDADVIAEAWVQGAEYTVSILAGEPLPVIRLKTPRAFYDYEAKYQSTSTEYLCPSGLSAAAEKCCQALAMRAFDALGMQGWGRIDVMADQQGDFFLIEANSVPGMTDHSLVPMAAQAAGISFETLVMRILMQTMETSP